MQRQKIYFVFAIQEKSTEFILGAKQDKNKFQYKTKIVYFKKKLNTKLN